MEEVNAVLVGSLIWEWIDWRSGCRPLVMFKVGFCALLF